MTTIIANDRYSPAQEKDRLALGQEKGQYTLRQILGIWALVALPMALLTWVIAPAIIPYSPLHHVLAVDDCRYGLAVCRIPSDHLP